MLAIGLDFNNGNLSAEVALECYFCLHPIKWDRCHCYINPFANTFRWHCLSYNGTPQNPSYVQLKPRRGASGKKLLRDHGERLPDPDVMLQAQDSGPSRSFLGACVSQVRVSQYRFDLQSSKRKVYMENSIHRITLMYVSSQGVWGLHPLDGWENSRWDLWNTSLQ